MSQNIWFTSDEHYGHKNIIKFCNRPYADVYEMQECLINNHNDFVMKQDLVYHLGDMFWRSEGVDRAREILSRLNGHHFYILGNHDELMFDARLRDEFIWVNTRARIKPIGGPNAGIVLDHFSGRVWDQSDKGSWQLYGHSHGGLPEDDSMLSMDVGVDARRTYRPISIYEVSAHMDAKMGKMRRRIEETKVA